MAIRTRCPSCGKRFSAPDDYRGRRVDCPRCGHRFSFRTLEELEAEAEAQARDREREAADRVRLDLIERRERRARAVGGSSIGEAAEPGSVESGFVSPFRRSRATADLLLLGAYVSLLLALAGAGLTVWLRFEGGIPSRLIFLICLVGWAFGGGLVFLLLKCLAELVWVWTSSADQLHEAVRLLQQVRANTEAREAERAEGG